MADSVVTPPESSPPTIPGYRVESKIARGGMGVVYKAIRLSDGFPVAIKMLRDSENASADERRRFRIEAEGMQRLAHPHIVNVFEIGHADRRDFFVMEYIDGGSLRDILRLEKLSPARAARIVQQVAEAVEYAHQAEIIHRDLTAANVMLNSAGEPKVTDFGLAKRLDAEATITGTGAVLGTPGCLAWEQAWGRPDRIGPPTDVHGLGAILYESVTGRVPYEAASAQAMLSRAMDPDDEPTPPTKVSACPAQLSTIIMRCLEKKPEHRYARAATVAEELQRFLRNEAIAARPPAAHRRVGKFLRRRWAWVSIACLLIFGAAGILLWQYAEAGRQQESEGRKAEQRLADLREAEGQMQAASHARVLGKMQDASESLAKAEAILRRLLQDEPDHERYLQLLMGCLHNHGNLWREAQDKAKALAFYQSARDVLETLRQRFGDRGDLRRGRARILSNLGVLLSETNDLQRGLESLEQAAADLRWFLARSNSGDVKENSEAGLVNAVHAQAYTLFRLQRFTEALNAYEEILPIAERLAETKPQMYEYQSNLASIHYHSGRIHAAAGNVAAARAALDEGLRRWEYILPQFNTIPLAYGGLAESALELAKFLSVHGKPEEVLASLQRGERGLAGMDLKDARFRRAQEYLRSIHLTHADVLVSLGKPGESIPQWDHAIALSPPAAQRGLVIRRAHAVACSGAHEQAMNVVDRLEAERDLTANQSYDLACVCAQAAAVVGIVPAVKEAYALRAIALLRQAVQSGFRAFETLKNDRDLDSLRSRPDFKALLEALMKSMQG